MTLPAFLFSVHSKKVLTRKILLPKLVNLKVLCKSDAVKIRKMTFPEIGIPADPSSHRLQDYPLYNTLKSFKYFGSDADYVSLMNMVVCVFGFRLFRHPIQALCWTTLHCDLLLAFVQVFTVFIRNIAIMPWLSIALLAWKMGRLLVWNTTYAAILAP